MYLQVQSCLAHLGGIENAHVAGQRVVGRKVRLSGEEIREIGGGCVELVEKARRKIKSNVFRMLAMLVCACET